MPSQIWSLLLFELDQEPQPVGHEWALLHVVQISAGLFEQFNTCHRPEWFYKGVSKWQNWPTQPQTHGAPKSRKKIHVLDNIIFLWEEKSYVFLDAPYFHNSPLQTGQFG